MMGFLRDCTGKGDRKQELTICDNGKEKLYIINQEAIWNLCQTGAWRKISQLILSQNRLAEIIRDPPNMEKRIHFQKRSVKEKLRLTTGEL